MKPQALSLAALLFLHPFHPKVAVGAFLMAAMFGKEGQPYQEFGGSKDFDKWVDGLQDVFKPPNQYVLALTPKKIPTRNVWFHWPEEWESVPYPLSLRDHFGMILIDQSAPQWYEPFVFKPSYKSTATNRLPFTDEMLEYCFVALVRGGKLVVVDGRKPVIVFTKNGKDVPE